MSKLAQYNKLIVAVIGLAVALGLSASDVQSGVDWAIGVLTAAGVYAAPNKTA